MKEAAASIKFSRQSAAKAERFIQTALRERAYTHLYQNSADQLKHLTPGSANTTTS